MNVPWSEPTESMPDLISKCNQFTSSACRYLLPRMRRNKCVYLILGLLTLGIVNLLVLVYTKEYLIPKTHSKLIRKLHRNRVPYYSQGSGINDALPIISKNSSSKQHLVILGYMRSGSTLCGDILQTHPDVFYVYESLLYLFDYNIPNRSFNTTDNVWKRTKPWFQRNRPYIPKPLEFLGYMSNCNITEYNVGFLTNIRHSRDFRSKLCTTEADKTLIRNTSLSGCTKMLQKKCDSSKTVLQKVVRLTMEEADHYLDSDPNLKIIHLIRDPRGSILSRKYFTDKVAGEMHKNYTKLCNRLWNDLKKSKEISKKHWGRILTVRYEDLAQNPMYISSTMYSFAGLQFLPEVKKYIGNITSAEVLLPSGRPSRKSTSRKDPFKTAYQWRSELPFSLVQRIDRDCREVYHTMGYLTFAKESQMRDLRIPAKLDYYGKNLMSPWIF